MCSARPAPRGETLYPAAFSGGNALFSRPREKMENNIYSAEPTQFGLAPFSEFDHFLLSLQLLFVSRAIQCEESNRSRYEGHGVRMVDTSVYCGGFGENIRHAARYTFSFVSARPRHSRYTFCPVGWMSRTDSNIYGCLVATLHESDVNFCGIFYFLI